MDIEHLPSQLHLSFNSSVDLPVLLSTAENLFPDAENIEIKDDTLYLYKPYDSIEFIHISQDKIGIIFSSDFLNSSDIEHAWGLIDTLIAKLGVSKLTKFNWKIKLVHPFSSKKERELTARKLSPIPGYNSNSVTLYPEEKQDYYIRLDMVKKDKKQYGLQISFVYAIGDIKRIDILPKLKSLNDEYTQSDKVEALGREVFGV